MHANLSRRNGRRREGVRHRGGTPGARAERGRGSLREQFRVSSFGFRVRIFDSRFSITVDSIRGTVRAPRVGTGETVNP